MSTFALDTSALVAWVLQENGRWRAIDALLSAQTADPVLPAPGLTELITTVRRRGNTSPASLIVASLVAKGVRFEMLLEPDLVRAAELSELSEAHPGPVHPGMRRPVTLSLGDSLILAIVERLGLQVVTLDKYWDAFAAAGHTKAKVLCT